MDKRTQILNAAETLLAERGFHGLSMKLLADTAGIAAGTIYRYFDNKEELMSELHQYISLEAAQTIFSGWLENQTAKQKYDLLWGNTFAGVLKNPQRLAVSEMLCVHPDLDKEKTGLLEDNAFLPLLDFYQQGVDEGRFHNWPIPALIALSFDSAINLAKKVLKQHLHADENLIIEIRDASWLIIQK